MLEGNSIMAARSLAIQAERLIEQAINISPGVHDIGPLSEAIARGCVSLPRPQN
jgi:hypothetical protein